MKKTKTKQGTEALTGKELLQKLKELSHLSRRAKARECGYVSEVKDGAIRVNIGEFLNAVLAAKGVTLDIEDDKGGRGREVTYRTSVHKNGQIVLGSAYTEAMGLKVGDEFEIKLGYKHIHLKQIEAEDDVE
ncbi:MAG: AbrB family transcriptional regulator [Thermosynechococcaceae cyanobacterium MS004]|nr:AbrB family transcriptional regulator [Thermosynechococcaceae cyanobacterium MS004]